MKRHRQIHLIFTLYFILLLGKTVVASTMDVEGKAIINGNLPLARELAYQDALRQASLSSNVQVYSSSSVDTKGAITDSMQLRTSQFIESSEIIHESIKDNILTLTIRAKTNDVGDSCNFTASQYRKKIAATFFPLQHGEHLGVIDYYGFDKGISTEILKRLSKTGNFLTHEANDITLYEKPSQAPFISKKTATGDTLLSQIALNQNVQYIISGVIRDLSTELESERNQYIPYLPSFNSFMGIQRKAKKRNLIIDFFLHDTLTGELLSKTHYSHSISDYNVIPEQAIAFGTKAFFDTAFGRLFDRIINLETANIQRLLSCRPFTMKVIDQKNGKLYLDAGISNKVRAGDILTIYIPDKPGEVFGVTGSVDQFGSPKTTIKINQVYPAYSTAIAESGNFTHQDIINGYLLAW